jgi:hypothetical protein
MSGTSLRAVHARWLATLVTRAGECPECPETLMCDEARVEQARREAEGVVYCALAVMVATGYSDRLAGNKAFVREVTARVWALAMDAPASRDGMSRQASGRLLPRSWTSTDGYCTISARRPGPQHRGRRGCSHGPPHGRRRSQ